MSQWIESEECEPVEKKEDTFFGEGLKGFNAAVKYIKDLMDCSHKFARNTLKDVKEGKPLVIKTAEMPVASLYYHSSHQYVLVSED